MKCLIAFVCCLSLLACANERYRKKARRDKVVRPVKIVKPKKESLLRHDMIEVIKKPAQRPPNEFDPR